MDLAGERERRGGGQLVGVRNRGGQRGWRAGGGGGRGT